MNPLSIDLCDDEPGDVAVILDTTSQDGHYFPPENKTCVHELHVIGDRPDLTDTLPRPTTYYSTEADSTVRPRECKSCEDSGRHVYEVLMSATQPAGDRYLTTTFDGRQWSPPTPFR